MPEFKLKWDETGERLYETGVDRVVLYKQDSTGAYPQGVAWNGVTAINENPSGADASDLWADNIKYLSLRAAEQFGATIEAYTYPDEWAECDGSADISTGVKIGQQVRKAFGLSYRTLIGNDVDSNDHGYKIHIIYGGTAAPSSKNFQTVNDSPEAITFSWEVSTIPVNVTGFKPTATVEIDSTKVDAAKLASLETVLYGSAGTGGSTGTDGRLPLPDEIVTLLQ